jgi:hypothetical protein
MMQTLTLYSRINADGILRLEVPFSPDQAQLEVTVTIKPVTTTTKTPEELGYQPGFFEEVAGGWRGEPLVREAPTELESREELTTC